MTLAQTIAQTLSAHGSEYSLEPHAPSMCSRDSARVACIDEASLAKSVVLEDERGFVLAVLPASRRVELSRLRDAFGRSLHLSREHDMARLFPDCAFGAVPPLGHAYGIPTVVDASLEECEEVFFEAGDHETLVRMNGGEFLDLLEEASVAEIADDNDSLTAALVLCEPLYRAQLAVGHAIAAPIGVGERWRARLVRSLLQLGRAFEEHVSETESADGLLGEVSEQAPRLWREVDALRGEHVELRAACADLQARVRESGDLQGLRKQVHDLLRRFEGHRHRGADLVYASFGVDIGGG